METDVRLFLIGAVLLRFLGDVCLVGESGFGGKLSSGLKICDGSIQSPVLVLRLRTAVTGVGGTLVVFRRLCRCGLLGGAGVNSSSSSCATFVVPISSSESSTMIFFFMAARRDGRVGDMEAISQLRESCSRESEDRGRREGICLLSTHSALQ